MNLQQLFLKSSYATGLFLFIVHKSLAFSNTDPNITIHDDYFKPSRITISPGQTVTWLNQGKTAHRIQSKKGHFNSGLIYPGQRFKFTFLYPGTYRYRCGDHYYSGVFSMRGVVIVK